MNQSPTAESDIRNFNLRLKTLFNFHNSPFFQGLIYGDFYNIKQEKNNIFATRREAIQWIVFKSGKKSRKDNENVHGKIDH
jgi:hypothetical protein